MSPASILPQDFMSKKSEEKYILKTLYFEYLKDTATHVDPFVKKFLSNLFKNEIKIKREILQRYRFGKAQLRPALVRLAFEIAGGKNWKRIIPACGALELRDTGYYCYDDIVDFKSNPELFLFTNIFINASSTMMLLMGNNQVTEELLKLDRDIIKGGFVELSEIKTEEGYLKKALDFNFWEQAFRVGALLSGANKKIVNQLGKIGKLIGTAYIIANDTWDFGKELEDFINGKKTLPILWAFKYADVKERLTLNKLFGREMTEAQKDVIRRIMVECGAIAYGKNRADEYCKKAALLLKEFKSSKVKELIDFSMTMTQNNRYYSRLDKFQHH